MNLIYRLLLKNTSPSRVIGFVISNFIGLAIIIGSIIFYSDASSIWTSDDSFIKNDYLVVNKKVTSSDLWGEGNTAFSPEEIEDIKAQPWVKEVGEFTANDYRVWATVGRQTDSRAMSTMLFFESVPDSFVDGVDPDLWNFTEEDTTVPIIISKDYLTLYNFGFAGSQGLPQLSENVMGSIPLHLTLTSENGANSKEFDARIVGYSNRLNTILVPRSFLDWSNKELGTNSKKESAASRLIISVNSPGDIAINEYLDANNLEVAGDKSASSASYLLKVVTGIVITIGGLITVMSLFILLLSVSLLMEKNREKLHSLLMLGYPLPRVAAPYNMIVVCASLLAYGGAVLCGLLLRGRYLEPLRGLGATEGSPWVGLMVGGILTVIIICLNLVAVRRRVVSSWRR